MSSSSARRTLAVSAASMPALAGRPALEAVRLEGDEALSQSFHYTLTLTTPEDARVDGRAAANVAIKQLVGHELTVHILLDGRPGGRGQQRHVSGLVTRARFLRLENRRALYEVVLEPWLALAQRSSDFRIFQNQGVQDILRAVLGGYNFPLALRTTGSYPQREFVVQYGETDYDFVSRLMHEWGLYFYFEHAKGKHTLVIADDAATHTPFAVGGYARIPFNASDASSNEEHCDHFALADGLRSGKWVTGDFDFTRPKADLKQDSALPRKTAENQRERFMWPGNYTAESHGQQLIRTRMEASGSPGQRAVGGGNLRGVVTGHTFSLVDHPQERSNTEYLVLATHLHIQDAGEASGQQAFECRVEFEAMPKGDIFRAEVQAPKPRTTGPQTAIVTGPAGREIWTDQYGRVKLSFHWNRYCTKDENSSCWVRVSSPWAGAGFGGIQIPRIGQEVIVDFEYGDPERPIVTGRVYNADNMPPWGLPANATQSGLLTRSSEGASSDNANAIRFEDKKGEEQLWLHAEKDQLIEVENDEVHTVGHDRTKTIDHDETNHIKNDRTETVDHNETITIHGQRTETVDQDESITIHQNRKERVDLDETISIGKNRSEDVGLNETLRIGVDRTETVGSNETITIGANRTESVANNETITIGQNRTEAVGLNDSITIGVNRDVTIGGAKTETIALAKAETIGLGKALTIGLAYQTTVGAAMNTTVALSQSEQVGLSKSTDVGKRYDIEVGDELSITVGKARLVMRKDGTIILNGNTIDLVADTHMGLDSKRIDIN